MWSSRSDAETRAGQNLGNGSNAHVCHVSFVLRICIPWPVRPCGWAGATLCSPGATAPQLSAFKSVRISTILAFWGRPFPVHTFMPLKSSPVGRRGVGWDRRSHIRPAQSASLDMLPAVCRHWWLCESYMFYQVVFHFNISGNAMIGPFSVNIVYAFVRTYTNFRRCRHALTLFWWVRFRAWRCSEEYRQHSPGLCWARGLEKLAFCARAWVLPMEQGRGLKTEHLTRKSLSWRFRPSICIIQIKFI